MANPEFRKRHEMCPLWIEETRGRGVSRLLELLVLKYLCKKRFVKSVRR
jgi:hypothetical protein